MSADIDSRIQQALRVASLPLPKAPRSIVVIGAGGIVHHAHLPAYQKAQFPVAALVDANLESAATLAGKFSVPLATTSLDEAIKKSPKDSVFDVAVDYEKDRIYFPLADMRRFGVDEAMIASRNFTPQFRDLMRYEVDSTRQMFAQGMPLIGRVDRELALDLDLFSRGGLEILHAIEQQDYNVLRERPSISKGRKIALMLRALSGKFLGRSAA
jgi:hypothetical protein